MKILVTVGTAQEYSFTRLYTIIEELCKKGVIVRDNVIVQSLEYDGTANGIRSISNIPNNEFKDLIIQSDVIISHSGTGTVTTALKFNKKVIVFPRLSKYQEHGDDHQIELAQLFEKEGYVLVAYSEEQLERQLNTISNFSPKPFISNSVQFNNLIISKILSFKI